MSVPRTVLYWSAEQSRPPSNGFPILPGHGVLGSHSRVGGGAKTSSSSLMPFILHLFDLLSYSAHHKTVRETLYCYYSTVHLSQKREHYCNEESRSTYHGGLNFNVAIHFARESGAEKHPINDEKAVWGLTPPPPLRTVRIVRTAESLFRYPFSLKPPFLPSCYSTNQIDQPTTLRTLKAPPLPFFEKLQNKGPKKNH